jgi:hypothetical protein
VNDLLAPENLRLPIHESKEAGIYVAGLREDIVTSPEQVGPETWQLLQGLWDDWTGADAWQEAAA